MRDSFALPSLLPRFGIETPFCAHNLEKSAFSVEYRLQPRGWPVFSAWEIIAEISEIQKCGVNMWENSVEGFYGYDYRKAAFA